MTPLLLTKHAKAVTNGEAPAKRQNGWFRETSIFQSYVKRDHNRPFHDQRTEIRRPVNRWEEEGNGKRGRRNGKSEKYKNRFFWEGESSCWIIKALILAIGSSDFHLFLSNFLEFHRRRETWNWKIEIPVLLNNTRFLNAANNFQYLEPFGKVCL